MNFKDPHSFADPSQGAITHIDFELITDFETRRIRGRARYVLDREVTGSFFLDTRNLTILEAGVRDGALDFALDEEDPIRGQRLHLKDLPGVDNFIVAFETDPGSSALQWIEPSQTAGGEHPYLFSQCQALHARSVFPCQDTPRVRFTYTARLRVPGNLTAVMSAERTEVERRDGVTVCTFRMPQAIPSYLFALAAGNIAHRDLGPRSRVYAEPEVVDEAAAEFEGTEKMIDEAERLFGPYVWDRFDLLVMPPSFPYGGMENPRLTFLTPTLIVGDKSMVNVVVHELAHSWTGNLVTNATWQDFWLNEGWTVYAERRILEALEGGDYARMRGALRRQAMHEDMKLFGIGSDPTRLHFDQTGIDPDEIFSTIPYEKGAALITRIEEIVGRDAFDPFIRDYMEAFRFKSITTNEFLEFLREKLPAAVDAIDLDLWVRKPGFPDDAPVIASTMLDEVEMALENVPQEILPDADAVKRWKPEQVELFLKRLTPPLTPELCERIEVLFALHTSRNRSLLTAFYTAALASGYEAAILGAEQVVSEVGRMLYLKPLYRALSQSETGKKRVRDLFEKLKDRYHPIAAGGIERILGEAGL